MSKEAIILNFDMFLYLNWFDVLGGISGMVRTVSSFVRYGLSCPKCILQFRGNLCPLEQFWSSGTLSVDRSTLALFFWFCLFLHRPPLA
jgi:hypothetical protein